VQNRYAKNKVEACKALGVSRQALENWIKFQDSPKARADGRIDLDKWRAYIQERGLKGGDTTAMEEEKLLHKRAQRKKVELDNEIKRGMYVLKSDIIPLLSQVYGRHREILRLKIENELPALAVGLDAPAIRTLCEKAIDSSLRDFCEYLETLKKDARWT